MTGPFYRREVATRHESCYFTIDIFFHITSKYFSVSAKNNFLILKFLNSKKREKYFALISIPASMKLLNPKLRQ